MNKIRLTLSIAGALAVAATLGVTGVTTARAGQPSEVVRGPAPSQAATMDIVDTAVAAGDFTTLATALEAAGLIETLKGPGPFTVFAPTDAAFDALPAGTVEGLLGDIPALTSVLLYHVVEGDVRAADVVQLARATTAQGGDVTIAVVDGEVKLNESVTVVATDIVASNGVIHVIDGVLLPPAAPADVAPPSAGSAGLLDGGDGSSSWPIAAGVALALMFLVSGGGYVAARVRAR